MYGIDKTTINNIKIKSVDLDQLKKNDTNVSIELASNDIGLETIEANTGEDLCIKKLEILDNIYFNVLNVGFLTNKQMRNYYATIQINLRSLTDDNTTPFHVSHYLHSIDKLKDHLMDRYGLEVDFSEACFKELEINVTNKMDFDFTDYEYMLNIMLKLAPGFYKSKSLRYEGNQFTGITFSNKKLYGKIYDKTKQLKDEFNIIKDGQYMRVEYRLIGNRKIEEVFKTSSINKISDQDILAYLKNQIYKDLIKPIEAHIKASEKHLIKVFNDYKDEGKHSFIRSFVCSSYSLKDDNNVPYLFDTTQLETIIKSHSEKNFKRNIRSVEAEFNKRKYTYNNFKKLAEFKTKFYINFEE